MAKKKALPEVVFVKREHAGTTDEYLSADEDRAAHVADDDAGDIVTVGRYKLVETIKLRRTVEVVP